MLVVESYECTRMKCGDVVLTFDSDELQPVGILVSANIDARGVMALEWSDGTRALLPDVRDKMAAFIAAAPTLSVRWLADDLLRASDLRQAAHNQEATR
jgi:hypothetical protein